MTEEEEKMVSLLMEKLVIITNRQTQDIKALNKRISRLENFRKNAERN